MNYNWNWSIFLELAPDGAGTYMDMLIRGLYWTISVSTLAWFAALILGIFIGALRTSKIRWLEVICAGYVNLFRNIPLLVQLFLWYFVAPELIPKSLGDWVKSADPIWGAFWTSVVCLTLFTSARIAEQIRAGIGSLPKGQAMAATAMGLNRKQVYCYVLMPITLRIVIPPLTSEALNIVKNSSLAFTIGLLEITGASRSMQEFTFQIFETFAAATILYLIINAVVVIIMHYVEKLSSVPGFIGTGR